MWSLEDLEAFARTIATDKRCGAVALHPPHWYREDTKWCDGKNQPDKRIW